MEEEVEIKEISVEDVQIPQCCREGWENCPHSIGNRKQEKKKRNIGL